MEERLVDYEKGYVFELMAQGGPTKVIKMLNPAEQKE